MAGRRFLSAVACLVLAGDASLVAQQRIAQRRGSQAAAPAPSTSSTAPSSRQTSRLTVRSRPADPSRSPRPFRGRGHSLFPLVWGWGPLPVAVDVLDAPLSADEAPTGGVQLDVQPWRASVFVDGEYAGPVEDFKGYYRHLDITAGPHQIAIVEDGYDPLVLDVIVTPGRTATYRGTLSRALSR